MKPKKNLNFTVLRHKFSSLLNDIPDLRQAGKVKISIHDAVMSGFACMYFQDPSLLQFQERLKDKQQRNNLKTIFDVTNIPKETAMREIIDGVDSEVFRPVFNDYIDRLQRAKHLEPFRILGNNYYFPIDGSQFFSSNDVHCDQCLVKNHRNGTVSYSHQVLQGGIMHPNMKQVIPFMPEQVCNSDGHTKQDCEMNAAKRMLEKLRKDHPQMGFIIGGDGLYSKQPIIEEILERKLHYLFVAKPDDHEYMMEWLDVYSSLNEFCFTDSKGDVHEYKWINNVPLNGREAAVRVNYLTCMVTGYRKNGEAKRAYKNSWITDMDINETNIKALVRAGRCRWKVENEVFNVMKNHGYDMERNYGHGKQNLCFNFFLLTLLSFLNHQLFELTDKLYQACREKFGNKRHFWETFRAYIKIIVYETWESLMRFALDPERYDVKLGVPLE